MVSLLGDTTGGLVILISCRNLVMLTFLEVE